MFMNHIENIGWIQSLDFTESDIDYNIAKDFGQVRIETMEKYYQALEISTQPIDNIKNRILRSLYLAFHLKQQIGSRFTCQKKWQ